jgi:hypothetical protein
MSAPAKRARRDLYREPSYVLLLLGVVLTSFGVGWLSSGRHLVAAIVITAVGLCLLVPMRIVRSRSGRWP